MTKDPPCPTCGETRRSEFWKDNTRKDGLQVQCKSCRDLSMTLYRARIAQDPRKIARRRALWRQWYYDRKGTSVPKIRRPSHTADFSFSEEDA